VLEALDSLYPTVGGLIEQGSFRAALDSVFAFVRKANKYFDEEQPWITIKNEPEKCGTTLNTCVQIIANLSVLLDPFLPFSSAKIRRILELENHGWSPIRIPAGLQLGPVGILFERIDKKVIQEEQQRLKESCGA
jgi:methionyl-tRNA synthetase